MLVYKTDANGQTTIVDGYEEIIHNSLSVLNRDFIYLNCGETILDLYRMRGSDNKDYFAVEEWTAKNLNPTIFPVVIDQESDDDRDFVSKDIYSTKQEALDHVAAKLQENAFQNKSKDTVSIFE